MTLGVDASIIRLAFIAAFVLLIAPYSQGSDYGVFKIPTIQCRGVLYFLYITPPILLVCLVIMYIPVWDADRDRLSRAKSVGKDSKYRAYSTPDIIITELQKCGVNVGDTKIVTGFTVFDLVKRLRILNSNLSKNKIVASVDLARSAAFTIKYAEPMEDEKLEDIASLGLEGVKPWHEYLLLFLNSIGVQKNSLKDMHVLDVGIGNALASKMFLNQCDYVTGVDISNKALEYAKNALSSSVRLINAQAENLYGIESLSVDLYISLRVYQSTLFDIKASLHEAYRVIVNGGCLVVSVPIMFLRKDATSRGVHVLRGLIPYGSRETSMSYADSVTDRVVTSMRILGFSDVVVWRESPFEIYIGAKK